MENDKEVNSTFGKSCWICPSEQDIITCECGGSYCPIHYQFHINHTCKLKSKKRRSTKEEPIDDDI